MVLSEAGISPKKSDSMSMMGQYLEDQILQIDDLDAIFGKKQKMKNPSTGSESVESWHEVEDACSLSKLAEDARAIWEETKLSELSADAKLGSCCSSMNSTVASASSTIASVSFTIELSVSSPSDYGTNALFRKSFSAKTTRSDFFNLEGSTLIEQPLSIDTRAEPFPGSNDAVLAAACCLLLQTPSAAATTSSAPTPSSAAALSSNGRRESATVEEFSLGSGWQEC